MDNVDALEYCETLLRHFKDDLSEWEDEFVRSVRDQVNRGRGASQKQVDVLDRLMEKRARSYGR